MFDLILHAIPVFAICLALEAVSFHFLPDDDELGYETRDARTSLAMGLGNVFVNLGWKLVVLTAFAAAYTVSPIRLPADNPLTWVALFFADDFLYYWYHRTHHTIRVLWASHVVHHSSEFYNLSTALRQPWTPFTSLPFWRPIELVMNTPSHHRVHHGSNHQYLDKNYGGILIVWDRLFGSFEAEGERVKYGLTTNLTTYNPLRVATHEFAAIWHDVRRAGSWRDRFGHTFRGPGWAPGS